MCNCLDLRYVPGKPLAMYPFSPHLAWTDDMNIFEDGSQEFSSDIWYLRHDSNSSSVGQQDIKPQMLPCIFMGTTLSFKSMPKLMYFSVGLSQTGTPKALSWFGFSNDLSISGPKYKPCPASSRIIEPSSKSTAVIAVQIGTSNFDSYESRQGETVQTSDMKYTSLKIDQFGKFWFCL